MEAQLSQPTLRKLQPGSSVDGPGVLTGEEGGEVSLTLGVLRRLHLGTGHVVVRGPLHLAEDPDG